MHLRPPTILESRLPSLRRALLAHLMRVANSNPCRHRWYPIKDTLCWAFALDDGYDVQEIHAECWHCVNGIDYTGNECYSCNAGVHHITRTALRRFVIEGFVFHRPLWRIESKEEFIELSREAKTVIRHRITHRPRSEAASREAFFWILLLMFGAGHSWTRLKTELRSGPTYPFHPQRPLLAIAKLRQTLTLRHLRYRWQRCFSNLLRAFDDIPF